MNKPTISGGSSKSGSHDRPPPEDMARSSAVFAVAVVRQELPWFVARLDHRSSR